MSKKMFNVLFVVCASILLMAVPAGTAGTAGAQEFSADMVSRTGKETMTARISVAQDKIRMEMPESIMIVRRDKNVSWVVMPAEKMYMEQPINMSSAPKVAKNFDGEIERVVMWPEAVDGQPAEKFKVTYVENGKNVSVYQWLRPAAAGLRDGQIPVKIEAVDGTWSMEYKNLQTGPQPADLFEPPAGYEKFDMPGMDAMMNLIQ